MAKRTRTPGTSDAVLRYLSRYPNRAKLVGEIARGTKLAEKQVWAAVAHLRAAGYEIESPRKGYYVLRGGGGTNGTAALEVGDLAEVITKLADGRPVFAVDGALFAGTPIIVE